MVLIKVNQIFSIGSKIPMIAKIYIIYDLALLELERETEKYNL